MTASRNIAPSGRASFTLLINGTEVPREVNILAIETQHEFNRIATARILVADGTAAGETYTQSSGEHFVPGNEVEIKMGYASEEVSVFMGVVVKQRISHNGEAGLLEITCKHKTFRMTAGEKFAVFEEAPDSDVINQILGNYGFAPDVETTQITHQSVVQYNSTDWDFIVNRAESNSMVVLCKDDSVAVFKPDVSAGESLELLFGATIIDFEAELDGRLQEPQLVGRGWNYDSQAAAEETADIGDVDTIGNLPSDDLASDLENNEEQSHYSALNNQEEVKAIAEAEHLRRRLSKIRARVTCAGTSDCLPGDMLKLAGLGDRFNGNILVSGVAHEMKRGVWKTRFQLGMNPVSHLEHFKPMPKSTYAIPRTQGLEIGKIKQLGDDPDGSYRAKVSFPTMQDEGGVWARVAQPDAGENRTVFFRPELDDEVIIGFINNDPRRPIVLGAVHSAAKASPIEPEDDNHKKGIVTRSEMKMLFDDELIEVVIETPNGNSIRITEDEGLIEIKDENENYIKLSSDGITMESASDISIKASGDITIEGNNVNLAANMQAKMEGSAGAEVSSGASTVIQGSIVQIN